MKTHMGWAKHSLGWWLKQEKRGNPMSLWDPCLDFPWQTADCQSLGRSPLHASGIFLSVQFSFFPSVFSVFISSLCVTPQPLNFEGL